MDEYFYHQEIVILVNLRMDRKMVLENIIGQMEIIMMDIGKKIFNKDLVNLAILKVEKYMKVILNKEMYVQLS